MYSLSYHKENDEKIVEEFIRKHPFAFLTGCDNKNRPIATQLPLFFENKKGHQILRGHIMKDTDHHKAFLNNENVLVVFTGKQSYVSGTWYSNPYTPSTWNYMSAHITGTIKFVNEKELEDILQTTTLHFENQNQESTTVFDNLPLEFKQKALKLIVGFEIEIKDIDTVFKLSQDRDLKSYQNIIKKLKTQDKDGHVIASEMEKRIRQLFPDEQNT